MNRLKLQERLKSSKIKTRASKLKGILRKIELEAQEQFEHIASIGFVQTTSKSKLK